MTEWTDESPSADPSHLLIFPPLPKCQNKAIHEPPAWIFVAPVISAHVCISRVSHVGKLMIRRYFLLHLLRAKSTHWTKKRKEKKSELSEAAGILWSKDESNAALLWFGLFFFFILNTKFEFLQVWLCLFTILIYPWQKTKQRITDLASVTLMLNNESNRRRAEYKWL